MAFDALAGGGQGGPLSGTWVGYVAGQPNAVARQHIVLVVNASESGGSWRLGKTCHGALALQSISGGYHHFLRTPDRGSTCPGGDVDCLKAVGVGIYDAVTSHRGGEYDSSGTLRRVPGS
jgi:hypothetical protein